MKIHTRIALVLMGVRVLPAQELASAPLLDIGSSDGPIESGRISSIAVSRTGQMFVLDNMNRTVVSIAADGALSAEFGREGGGPGEFERPSSILLLGDSVVVFDAALGRATYFSREGEVLRTEATTFGLDQAAGRAVPMRGGVWLVEPVVISDPSSKDPPLIPLVAIGPQGRDTLTTFPTGTVTFRLKGERYLPWPSGLGRGGYWTTSGDMLLTFIDAFKGFRSDYAVSGDGRVELMGEEPLGLSPRPVTEEDRAVLLDRLAAVARIIGRSDAPRDIELFTPPFRAVIRGAFYSEDGRLWLRLDNAEGEEGYRRWLVVSPDGSRTRRTMPNGFTPLAASVDRLIGVYRDELDIEYLRVYEWVG